MAPATRAASTTSPDGAGIVGILASVLYLAVLLYLLALLARLVIDWIQSMARDYRPRGAALLLFEAVYTVTDGPVRGLRRAIPPLRIGGMALDLSLMILLIGGWLLLSILSRFVV